MRIVARRVDCLDRPGMDGIYRWVLALSCWLALAGAGSLPARAAHGPESVRLRLKWTHAFQFAGYYAAQEKGYYREAGLEVTIDPGRGEEDSVKVVLAGQADFGVGNSTLLLERAAGRPVVALGAIFQHSPMVLLARRERPGQSVKDLVGKRVQLLPQCEELLAYLGKEGVPPGSFTLVGGPQDLEALRTGSLAAAAVYITDQPFTLRQAGVPFTILNPRDAGVDFYGDTLFTTEEQLRSHPECTRKFLAASLRGWNYAMAHPEELVDLILSRYGTSRSSREHLLYEAQQMIPLVDASTVEIGYMSTSRWRAIAGAYARLGLLPKAVSLDGFVYAPDEGSSAIPTRFYGYLGASLGGIVLVSALTLYILGVNRSLRRSLSEEARAKAELDRSEALFRALADTSPAGVAVYDETGFVSVNGALAAMTGRAPRELLGMKGLEAVHPDHRDAVSAYLEGREDGSPRGGPLEARLRARNGEERLVQITRTGLGREAKPISSVTFIDITEPWRAFQGEKTRSRILELLAWGASQGRILEAIVLNLEAHWPGTRASVVLVADDRQHLVVGAAPSLPPSYHEATNGLEIGSGVGACGTVVSFGKQVFVDDVQGHPYWGRAKGETVEPWLRSCWAEPIRSSTGRVVGVLAVYWDRKVVPTAMGVSLLEQSANLASITLERSKATRALQQSELRHRLLAENSSDVIWTATLDGHFTYVSPSVEKHRGYTVSEVLQVSFQDVVAPESAAAVRALLADFRACVARGEPCPEHQGDYEMRRKDGTTVWAEIRISGLRDPSGACVGILGVSRDATKRRQSEQELTRKNMELEALNRKKNHLLGMAAHDLRNPLATVRLCANYLLDEGPPLDDSQRMVVASVRDSADFMVKLIGDLLDVSQIESGEIQLSAAVEDIASVARFTVELNRILAATKRIDLELAVEEGIPPFSFDRQKIAQVMNNLVSNALKFSLPGTTVRVSVARQDDRIVVTVADEGRGIQASEMGKLFKPFSRTSTRSTAGENGTGLGLFISKRLVVAHGGDIWVESRHHEGSAFSFSLPIVTEIPVEAPA